MKTFDVVSRLGADRLQAADPNRDEKRGGNGKGRIFARKGLPYPESDKEVATACEKFNDLAKTKGWKARISLVKAYEKAVSLVCQAEMNAAAFDAYGEAGQGKTKTPKDLSNADEI